MDYLKLIALDEDDLAVVSAHLQDAQVRLADMAFLAKEQRFVLIADRLDWHRPDKDEGEHCRSGIHFERVQRVRSQGIDRANPDKVLTLVGVMFTVASPPAGQATLLFEGGGSIQLDVECIEAQLMDLDTGRADT